MGNHYTECKEALVQISVPALSMINSFVFRPVIDISVYPQPSDKNIQNMNYTIF